ncbi:MAG TPA: hypothetical protein PLS78_05840, partial [bacterium]|nr:hypothetical protein [bacterium]
MKKILLMSTLFLIGPFIINAVGYTLLTPTTPQENLPSIIIHYDEEAKSGYNIDFSKPLVWYDSSKEATMRRAGSFIQESIKKMTGRIIPLKCSNDISKGIVLLMVKDAPDHIKNDPQIKKALANDGTDSYNNKEAYYIKTEPNRVLVIANNPEGIIAGVVDLMESTGYEILGMGPNWIYAPDYKTKPVVFNINKAGRPGFYIRALWPTSGQSYGVGTIMEKPPHPDDETVDVSWYRWSVGAKIYGSSMPGFPGHAMQAYHKSVIEAMKRTNTTEGFLVPKASIGLFTERPEASTNNNGEMWINSAPEGTPQTGKVYISNGKEWIEQSLLEIGANLDLSVPLVRQVILEEMKKQSEQFFEKNPDEVFIFGHEPEDGGGYSVLDKYMKYKNWYPDYCKKEGIPFGKPY